MAADRRNQLQLMAFLTAGRARLQTPPRVTVPMQCSPGIYNPVVDKLCNNLTTRNQVSVTSLSGCVPKILTLHGMSKIDFQPDFRNALMLSFLLMYNTMGSKVNGLAVREHFL